MSGGGHVAIVGAGPAGLMAAVEAHRQGARVTLIDEAPRPGGQIYRQPHPNIDPGDLILPGEAARKRVVLDAFAEIADAIDYRPDTTAYAAFPGPEIHISDEERSESLKPDALVLATGVSERAIPFPGWTLPGVMYAGGMQAMMKEQGIVPPGRIMVVGAGPLPIAIAAQMVMAGADVIGVVLLNSLRSMLHYPFALWRGRSILREGLAYNETLKQAGVPVTHGWFPLRAEGNGRVESLILARVGPAGHLQEDSEIEVQADAVAMNYGFTANSELARMAGVPSRYDALRGGWLPMADGFGRTEVPGIYVAGDGAGLRGAPNAAAEGRLVGAAAAAEATGGRLDFSSRELTAALAERRRQLAFQKALAETWRIPDGVWQAAMNDIDTVVCRCEGVSLRQIMEERLTGHDELDGIKRRTRAGMGPCGGRTCLQAVEAIASLGWPADPEHPGMRARPPARPVTLGALANRDGS